MLTNPASNESLRWLISEFTARCDDGDTTLFQRAEFVEEGWKLVQPLLDAWGSAPGEGFPNYAAGSAGPKAADELLAASGHAWRALG